ncbi:MULTISPECIES: ADP-ribosylglycohydrolase family protein [Alphaproteobacteria]|uniref:ADP-ribosylglycohydrolase family protein n=1 Tax=Alphaproteobacteria TaxID=28211 RepID=UPI001C9475FF|nr:ADP-ribosylglycohydrolase family protein [Tritonibacter mobilis]MBY6002223.1 ADP-ribosylglycohydrolase family protein [Tritonibacter mobilis]
MTQQGQDGTSPFRGRVRAMVHGVAFGDAMGAPVEKLSAAEIRERYGRVTSLRTAWHRDGQSEDQRKGRVRGNGITTDDTAMTLSLMRIYEREGRHLDAWDMAEGMVREIAWESRWVPELQRETPLIERLFYPEKWIFQRLQLSACDPRQGGVGNMVNCGATMYIAPVGAVNACNPRAAYDEAINFAEGHQQSYGLEAAGVFAAAIAQAFVPGATLSEVVQTAYDLAHDGTRTAIGEIVAAAGELARKGAEADEVTDTFHRLIAPFSPMGDNVAHGPEKAGVATAAYQPSRLLSIEELPLALGFCITAGGDFRQGVIDGINSGRDTDSIGVMVGAILGAMHGPSVIDEDDAELLDSANRFCLSESADRFTTAAQAIIQVDEEAARARAAQRAAIFAQDKKEAAE